MSTLYLVATPIGNLSDFSPRAVEVLQSVDYIACEDTRNSGILLKHYDINKPTFSFHQHNEHSKVGYLINLLDGGKNVGLISDAGMPGISDPGFLAARSAHQNGHTVTAIPGPDAATTALVASGLPCDRYVYEGFLPRKKGRNTRLNELADEERSVIIYESPYRVIRLLDDLLEHCNPDRMAAVCRELTKQYEEILRGTLQELRDTLGERGELKGEFVIILAGCDYQD